MQFIFKFLVVAIVIAAVIRLGVHLTAKAKERHAERKAMLAEWAASIGFSFHPDMVSDFDQQYPSISWLRLGSNRYAYHVISGKRSGLDATAFDYHYETKSTNSNGTTGTNHHHFNAILLKPEHRLKPLVIRREGIFDKLKAGFGSNDIDFESAEFSKRFHVTSPDKRWAHGVLQPRTMELLLERAGNQAIEIGEDAICIIGDRELSPHGFDQAFELAEAILDGIPGFAVEGV